MRQPLHYVHPLKQQSFSAELKKFQKKKKSLKFFNFWKTPQSTITVKELKNKGNFIGNETLNIKNTSW